MKTFKGSTLVVASILLVLAAQGTAAGPTTTVSTVYTVGALTVPGVNTGLVLRKGDSVTVTAAGTVCYWPGPPATLCVDPDGEPSINTTTTGGFVLPGAPAIGLIARVGTGPWVHVGSGPTTLSGRGVLVFAVNDNWFPDNSGSFEVTVSVSEPCKPGWGWGDKNHCHSGPPGLDNKPSSPGQSSGATHGSSGEHSNSQGNPHGNSNPPGNANGHSNPPGNSSGQGASGRP
jgi:PA-IL-like protein